MPKPEPPTSEDRKSGHTPGPWKAEGARVYADRKGGALIATMAWFPGQEVANARLMAAAPDLLAALLICAETIELKQIRAAIAKATGVPNE
jgi:hypothetical protein